MPDETPDIDLMLITGAGASTKLGGNGQDLPLMSDWSNIITERLLQSPPYLDLVGLERDLSGPEFEERLGLFLEAAAALDHMTPVLLPSAGLPWPQPSVGTQPNDSVLKEWHRNTRQHCQQALKMIRASLDDAFGANKIYPQGATDAYGRLLQALGVTSNTRFVFATTNYDVSAEIALDRLGYRPDWGESASPLGNFPERELRVDGILDGLPRSIPVLHLHGRVNWLLRTDGAAVATGAYQESSPDDQGIPIAMLPHINKDYESDSVLSSLWRSFRQALARSHRVFILGHSLNDAELVAEIVGAFPQGERVGISFRGDTDRPAVFDSPEHEERIAKSFPKAHLVPLEFGPDPVFPGAQIGAWRES
jgi:hypothetical protein